MAREMTTMQIRKIADQLSGLSPSIAADRADEIFTAVRRQMLNDGVPVNEVEDRLTAMAIALSHAIAKLRYLPADRG